MRDRGNLSALLAVGAVYVDFAVKRRPLFEIIFDPIICNPQEPNPVTGPLVEANDEFLTTTVEAVLPTEASDTEVDSTAAGLWGAIHGLAVLASTGI